MSIQVVTGQPPSVGIPVKLKKGQLLLSARQIQHIKAVKKLDGYRDEMTTEQIIKEGGYWIKTTHTNGEWWAWSLFKVA